MSDLDKYINWKFADLFPLVVGKDLPVDEQAFGDRKVTAEDIAVAFPQNIVGLISVAAAEYISDAEFTLLDDQ